MAALVVTPRTPLDTPENALCTRSLSSCRLMDMGFVGLLLDKLKVPDVALEFVAPACGTVRSVVTADDDRPPASKAFMHARLLAKTHSAIRVLLSLVKRVSAAQQTEVLAAVLSGVRMLAANEEICKEFSDDGGVLACLEVIRCAARPGLRAGARPLGFDCTRTYACRRRVQAHPSWHGTQHGTARSRA